MRRAHSPANSLLGVYTEAGRESPTGHPRIPSSMSASALNTHSPPTPNSPTRTHGQPGRSPLATPLPTTLNVSALVHMPTAQRVAFDVLERHKQQVWNAAREGDSLAPSNTQGAPNSAADGISGPAQNPTTLSTSVTPVTPATSEKQGHMPGQCVRLLHGRQVSDIPSTRSTSISVKPTPSTSNAGISTSSSSGEVSKGVRGARADATPSGSGTGSGSRTAGTGSGTGTGLTCSLYANRWMRFTPKETQRMEKFEVVLFQHSGVIDLGFFISFSLHT